MGRPAVAAIPRAVRSAVEGGRFDGRRRGCRVGLGGRRVLGRFPGGVGSLEGRVKDRRMSLEHKLDGLAQVLQQVPAVGDLLGLGGASVAAWA